MPYVISKTDLDSVGVALAEYYETAWQEGVKGLFDNMARSQMGIVTGYLDQAKDTYTNLRKKSNDAFGITFKPALKQYVAVYFANKNDVASMAVTVAEKALTTLASKIPVPALGTVVSGAISFAADKGRAELHERSVKEADKQLAAKTGQAATRFFTTDTEAAAFVQKSIDQYKLICNYIQTMPGSIRTFDDAVTYPGAAFRVQQAASSLNVALISIEQYLAGMRERLTQVQTVSKEYIANVRRIMPDAVNEVLQKGYQDAYAQGESDIARQKYSRPATPTFRRPDKPGGATQLAAFLANAVAQGYYDSGNRGPVIAKGAPPVPPRPPIPPFKRS